MKKLFVILSAAVLSIATATTASAASLTWNLFDVKFQTGTTVVDTATATGFFTYDAATNIVSNFDINVSGGTVSLANGGLADANHHYIFGTDNVFVNAAGNQFFFCTSNCFGSNVNLTLAVLTEPSVPGTLLLTSSTLDCPRCGTLATTDAALTTNGVTTTAAVPEPATLALIGTGLAVAAMRLRRRKV